MTTLEQIKAQIQTHPILLYMKGTPAEPKCGFSARAVRVLERCGRPYMTIDILENPDIREVLPQYAHWPTFPQLYIQGELIGGSDIMLELFEKNELQSMMAAV